MSFFLWEDRYSVGISTIDRHHKVLVSYINQLAAACEAGGNKAELGALLKNLRTYTKMHFTFEEAMFRQYDWRERDEHQHYHDALVRKVDDFAQRFEAGSQGLELELLAFLKQWLNHHILHEDMSYSEFLRERMKASRAPAAETTV